MRSLDPLPGANAPGALPAEGQAGRAGDLAHRLTRELGACREIMEAFDRIERRVHPQSVYKSYIHYALDEYENLALSDNVDGMIAESIGRVVNACNTNVKLTDFAELHETLGRLRMAAKEEEVMELAGRLERMTLAEFIGAWEDVVEKLEKHDLHDVLHEIFTIIDYTGRLARTLDEELKKIATERHGMSEEQAERLIECLVEC